MTIPRNAVSTALVGLLLGSVILLTNGLLQRRRRLAHLKRIPTIGSEGFLASYLNAFRYIRNARPFIQEGYDKYRGERLFKVPTLERWLVIASGDRLVDEIKRAPDHKLSIQAAAEESLQGRYTIGDAVFDDHYHPATLKGPLTRNIAIKLPEVRDEIVAAFEDEIPVTKDWIQVPIYEKALKIICRASNRLFVGLPLCRNPEYIDLNITYTIDVAMGAQVLRLFPNFLKPLMNRFLTNVPKKTKQAINFLRPLIEERKAAFLQREKKTDFEYNDLIGWLLEAAEGHDNRMTVEDLSKRVLAINLAAIHTTGMAFTTALYYLAAHPQYIPTLREEVEAVVAEFGWSKAATVKLRKMDSFLKETQRLTGLGAFSMMRVALEDFTFPDGTTVPAGTHINVPQTAIHYDADFYENPHEFKPWRFSEMREGDGKWMKHQMVTTSDRCVIFGHGRHACPGRFFAVMELKNLIANVIVKYDVKFEKEGVLPEPSWFSEFCIPNTKANVLLRART